MSDGPPADLMVDSAAEISPPVDMLLVDASSDLSDSAAPDSAAPDSAAPDADPPLLTYFLDDAKDVLLSTFLSQQGAPAGAQVKVIVIEGSVVGATSTSGPALASGDLSSYAQVILEIAGEVQGAGGAPGAPGGDALWLSSPLCLRVTSTGAIRAGGGGGGGGGRGGEGNDAGPWSAWMYSDVYPKSFWSPSWNYIAWQGVHDIATGQMCCSYAFEGGWVYNKGDQVTDAPLPILFRVRRAPSLPGTPGDGGIGGRGRGYGQPRTAGAVGAPGDNRAGDGGTGGTGGDWGEPGHPGKDGVPGSSYSATSSTASHPGTSGSAGGAAGVAVRVEGLTIPFENNGVIAGSTTFTPAPACEP